VWHIRDRKSNERLEESHLSALPSHEGGQMTPWWHYALVAAFALALLLAVLTAE
jgi:type VI protein secretion system component VasF